MRHAAQSPSLPAPPADSFPRLLAGIGPDGGPMDLDGHLRRWGPPVEVRRRSHHLLDELDASGLRGHGGAWFPVGAKWRSIDRSLMRRPVVVVNGSEGEPASGKDGLLLTRAPHLVIDGAVAAADALGADRVVVYVTSDRVRAVSAAIAEREARRVDHVDVDVAVAPHTYVSGQETAVVSAVNGKRPLPTFQGVRSIRDRGVDARPTLVQNAETMAHVALVARFGAAWFRGLGTDSAPGTMLLTVTGRWDEPTVVEAPLGTPLRDVLRLEGGEIDRYQGVLLGGYGGVWVTPRVLASMHLTEEDARSVGASLGAGVVALLPHSVCPLAEVARVAWYMEREGAGQCGPCVNGLAGLSRTVADLAFSRGARPRSVDEAERTAGLVAGRGACRHPDGVARFVTSALKVFRAEVESHLRNGPCRAVNDPALLPVPDTRPLAATGVSR